jgi:hypothetical protein
MRRHHPHLRPLPSPRARRPVERLDSAPILMRLAEHGDRQKVNAAFMAALAERNDAIAGLQARLDEVGEDRDAWRLRALTAEGQLRRPGHLAALYALVALGWQSAWAWFETDASRASEA